MKTMEQILKIRATVLYILNAFPEGIDSIKLFKILYYAQQQHLVTYGRAIINDTFEAWEKGPVCKFVRKGLKSIERSWNLDDDFRLFGENIRVSWGTNCQNIKASEYPDLDELSVSEIKCLDAYIDKFRNMDSKDVSDFSHQDKAWITAFHRAQVDPQLSVMTILEIADAGGANPLTLEYIRENLELDQSLN